LRIQIRALEKRYSSLFMAPQLALAPLRLGGTVELCLETSDNLLIGGSRWCGVGAAGDPTVRRVSF
jgi:hypothetical protein